MNTFNSAFESENALKVEKGCNHNNVPFNCHPNCGKVFFYKEMVKQYQLIKLTREGSKYVSQDVIRVPTEEVIKVFENQTEARQEANNLNKNFNSETTDSDSYTIYIVKEVKVPTGITLEGRYK